MNILIADSGSTKTNWCLVKADGTLIANVKTEGLNPFFLTPDEMTEVLRKWLMPQLGEAVINHIYFYGAGCTPQKAPLVIDMLRNLKIAEAIEVHSDMLGAARALCQKQTGIACILGTGANSCSYDGRNIVANISPLGYVLGDEGSGAVLSKLFIGAVLKNQMPDGLRNEFLDYYQTTPESIIHTVYNGAKPNTYLASFCPFIAQHLYIPEVYRLSEDAFRLFIRRNVKQYPNHQTESVHFTGSVAYHFREPLTTACDKEGIHLGTILQDPISGLIKYHTN